MKTNPVSGKACLPTKGGLICLYMQPLPVSQTTEFVICISIYIRLNAGKIKLNFRKKKSVSQEPESRLKVTYMFMTLVTSLVVILIAMLLQIF